VALILFFAIGLTEDLRGVPTLIRLALQLATSVVVSLLLLLGVPHLPAAPVLVVVAALWITGFANAFNFMDGINGISGAHAVLCGIAFMVIGKITRHPSLIVIAAIIVAAGLAFLPWNAMRPRVFLGDVGSYTLGAVLAVLAIYCVLHGVPLEAVLAPMSLYLADTGWTLLRRILRKDAWMQAHREHAYQRLCSHGWAHHQVTMLTFGIGLVVTALGGVSITGNSLARVLADSLILVLLAVYLATPYYIVGMRASRVVTNLPADPETETMTTAGSTPQAEAELEAELQAELQANPVAASPS
jgi:UDP-N-acetylmuramyl pentapeptide phosphotransferase/UDP-N-acetylglucosamine-1-phosphate transferase